MKTLKRNVWFGFKLDMVCTCVWGSGLKITSGHQAAISGGGGGSRSRRLEVIQLGYSSRVPLVLPGTRDLRTISGTDKFIHRRSQVRCSHLTYKARSLTACELRSSERRNFFWRYMWWIPLIVSIVIAGFAKPAH